MAGRLDELAASEGGNYKIALIQMACSPDADENVRRAVEFIGEAAHLFD